MVVSVLTLSAVRPMLVIMPITHKLTKKSLGMQPPPPPPPPPPLPSTTPYLHVLSLDGCESELFKDSVWPETELGVHASSQCPCAEFLDSLAGRVLRFCGGDYSNGAQWSENVDTSMCAALMSDVTNILCEAAAVSLLKHCFVGKNVSLADCPKFNSESSHTSCERDL